MTSLVVPLSVRALTHDDLTWCRWSGSRTHLDYVAEALDRTAGGDVAYLAVCPPSDLPVAIGGVDFTVTAGAGALWQLVVHPALRSCGLGSVLVRACEATIRERGILRAELGVETDNPRARALYERLGYLAYDQRVEEWNDEHPDGSVRPYVATCVLMGKNL